MRKVVITVGILIVLVTASYGGDNAVVTSMRTVKCGAPLAKSGLMAALAGPEVTADNTCMEFTLRTSRMQYRLRPEHNMLLPVGKSVRVRIDKKHVMVQAEDEKEVRCGVVSMDLLDENGEPIELREQLTQRSLAAIEAYPSRRLGPRIMPGASQRRCLNMEGEVVTCGD
jgi:hypothetical protein